MKGLISVILPEFVPISLWFNVTVATYWKHLLSFLLMGFIVAFYPVRKIFIWSTMIQIYFLTLAVQQINTIKGKITTFHWRFRANRIWYLEKSDWKSSSIISSALSLIMISVLSLCECITRSSSWLLEDIKLIAIVKWIFHVSDILRSFISFKYGLTLLRYSSIDSALFLSLLLSYSI